MRYPYPQLILIAFLFGLSPSVQAGSYSVRTVEEIIDFDIENLVSLASLRLDDLGGIAGEYSVSTAPGTFPQYIDHAFYWNAATGFHTLNSGSSPFVTNIALNNQNVISVNTDRDAWYGNIHDGLDPVEPYQPAGSLESYTVRFNAINDSGFAAGHYFFDNNRTGAVIWNPNTLTYSLLEDPENRIQVMARDINSSGIIVGSASSDSNEWTTSRALYWDSDGAHSISSLNPDNASWLSAANDAGIMIGGMGVEEASGTTIHPFVWDGTNLTDLGLAGGLFFAEDINNMGEVVGAGFFDLPGDVTLRAFFWDASSGLHYLDELLDDSEEWSIYYISDINNHSEMLATGIFQGESVGFLEKGKIYDLLLTPTLAPEPFSAGLFLLGGAALIAFRRLKTLQ